LAVIELDQVSKHYVAGRSAVSSIDLTVDDGEFMVLVGPSGCGKSTLLRLLAGLEQPTAGTIRIDGVDVSRLPPAERDVAMVFQNYAIYPHMSVRRNIGYGLRVRGGSKREVAQRVDEVAAMLGLSDLLNRRPSSLSGGQLQRVAMGRAIARHPQLYLMDEPLSNLDAKLRVSMRAELEELHTRLGVTTVYVTHDQVEAMTLGGRAAVLREGVLQQVDAPQRLYDEPADAFVAAFIGSPPINFAIGRMREGALMLGDQALDVPDAARPPVPDGESVLVGIRPEDLRDPRTVAGGARLEVECAVRQNLGADVLLFFPSPSSGDDYEIIQRLTASEAHSATRADRQLLCARIATQFPARAGDRLELVVPVERLHFFDPDTGTRLRSGLDVSHPRADNDRGPIHV